MAPFTDEEKEERLKRSVTTLVIFPLSWFPQNTGDGLKKMLLWFMSESVLPMFFFSSRSFIMPSLTFRSLIYFELIFVYGVKEWSIFIFLYVRSHVLNKPSGHLQTYRKMGGVFLKRSKIFWMNGNVSKPTERSFQFCLYHPPALVSQL